MQFAVILGRVIVASGIVLTVSGAASSVTYMVSANDGSLTLVEAQSGRCSLAPRALAPPTAGPRRTAARTARRPAARSRARPCPRSACASGVPILSSRPSTSVSTRLTKNEATEAMRRDVPAGGLLQARQERVDDLAVALQARRSASR